MLLRSYKNIGIDLDNTIIDYEDAFAVAAKELNIDTGFWAKNSRSLLRALLRETSEGELAWQALQGQVYGKYLQKYGRIYSGFGLFLWRCNLRGMDLRIYSHKTEYGNFDKAKIPLREVANKFLSDNKINTIKEVRFFESAKEKIQAINTDKFDIFIDDLPEILTSIDKEIGTKGILFYDENSDYEVLDDSIIKASGWIDIDRHINGKFENQELVALMEKFGIEAREVLEIQGNGKNSAIYKIIREGQSSLKLKIYPAGIGGDRLSKEYDSVEILKSLGFDDVPKPILKNKEFNIGIYEWIDGSIDEEVTIKKIDEFLDFIKRLKNVSNHYKFQSFGLATSHCNSLDDIKNEIFKREKLFIESKKTYSELNAFLECDFQMVKDELIKMAEKWNLKAPSSTAVDSTYGLVLSPSDFGLHNSIVNKVGKRIFIDFEYFGYDDPVKLIADFAYHPGMSLNQEQERYWVDNALRIFGPDAIERFYIYKPLYGLIWVLIILNEYRNIIWSRRADSNNFNGKERDLVLGNQLYKAKMLLNRLKNELFGVDG